MRNVCVTGKPRLGGEYHRKGIAVYEHIIADRSRGRSISPFPFEEKPPCRTF